MVLLRNIVGAIRRPTAVRRSAVWLAGERAFRLCVSLLVSIAVVRSLSVDEFGDLATAVAVLLTVTAVMNSAVAVIVRDLAQRRHNDEIILATSCWLMAIQGLVTALVILAVVVAWEDARTALDVGLVCLVLVAVVFQPPQVVDAWLQAHMFARFSAASRSAGSLSAAGLRLCGVALEAPVTFFAAMVVTEIAVTSVALLYAYVQCAGSRFSILRPNLTYFRSLNRSTVPLLVAGLAVSSYMRLDLLLLAAYRGTDEVAVYAVAVSLAEVLYFLPGALVAALGSRTARLGQADRAAYRSLMERAFLILAAVGYVIAGATAVVALTLVPILYGEPYRGSVSPLLVLAAATPFVFLGVAQSLATVVDNAQSLTLARCLLAAVCNLALNILLIPRYGAVGAAAATLAAQVISGFLGNMISRRTWPVLRMQTRGLLLIGLTTELKALAGALGSRLSRSSS